MGYSYVHFICFFLNGFSFYLLVPSHDVDATEIVVFVFVGSKGETLIKNEKKIVEENCFLGYLYICTILFFE